MGDLLDAAQVDVAIGAKVAEARRRRSLSQAALGAILGVSQQQVQKYEKGANGLTASSLYRIAEALGCQPSDFLNVTSSSALDFSIEEARELLDGYMAMHDRTRSALLAIVHSMLVPDVDK